VRVERVDCGVDPHYVASDGTSLKTMLDTQQMSADTLQDPVYLAFVAVQARLRGVA
jgi:hypothetical protein